MIQRVLRGPVSSLAVATCLATIAAAAPPQRGYYEDPRYGFKIKPPSKWEAVPSSADDVWLVQMYVSDHKNFFTDPDTKYTFEHRSEMRALAFVHKKDEEAVASTEELDELLEDAIETPDEVRLQSPFEDYEEYLDRTYSGGGFYIAEREEDEVGGVPLTRLAIKVEKLARSGPKHIETWVYHLDGLDLAVHFEVLEEAWTRERKDVLRALRSFKEIERTEPLEAQSIQWLSFRKMSEGAPEERRRKRSEAELAFRKKIEQNLTDGWFAERMGSCYMVSHVDEDYTEEVAEQSTALLEWLDRTFSYIGPEEYVREPVIRICADLDEEEAFRSGTLDFTGTEIVTHKNPGNVGNWEWQWTNAMVYGVWFRHRDYDLYAAMPTWITIGLNDFVRHSFLGRRGLEFRPNTYIMDELRNFHRDGKDTPPRELIRMGVEQFGERKEVLGNALSAMGLVRFLMDPEAKKSKLAEEAVKEYLLAVSAEVAEIERERKEGADAAEKPTTEEEENEWYKERANRWKKEERRILDAAWEQTFGKWGAKDWERFQEEYYDYID